MLGCVVIVHIYIFLNLIFSFKARRGLHRQNCCRQNSAQCQPARSQIPRSISLRRVRLRAVLATFRFSENLVVDSAQCQPILDLQTILENISEILHMDPRFPGNGDFRKIKKISLTLCSVSLRGVRLRAVSACAESDSVQCQTILDLRTFQFPTPRRLTLCRVELRAV